ncbi:hypothetical protein E2R68_11210 [Psychromonas sp. RZ22]|uniref:hypothetical protein n=1 Tax=Psychromonas algarum TaxID=2555643 RepID=UPI001067A70C|nr:hypothetical protein [Psychromonas sp. RZ22]TEW53716.1 hypothetical protein E2R68_11210 [Psychromonas sp. RZ22]
MMNKILISIASLWLLSGCSSHSVGPLSAGKNSYVVSKQLSSFASKKEDLLTAVFSQANEYCLNKNRYMKVESLNEYIGLIGNDSKTTLHFSCLTQRSKVHKPTPTPVVKKQIFPKKEKLTNYAF